MNLRHGLAALALAMTAATASAGLGETSRAQLEEHKDFPRPMPGFVMPPPVQNTWESIRDWFRMQLGVATPCPPELS